MMFTLADLARAVDMPETRVRAHLRRLGIDRPKGRWHWESPERFKELVARLRDMKADIEGRKAKPKPSKRRKLIGYAGKEDVAEAAL